MYKGKVTEMFEKGALVAMDHDVEAFAPKRHLEKDNGSNAGVGEELDFKVLEFSKENKLNVVGLMVIPPNDETVCKLTFCFLKAGIKTLEL